MYRTLYSPQGGRIILDGREVINMASNNYLGLANHPAVVAAAKEALEKYGVATTASRTICGNYPVHDALEEKLAKGRRGNTGIQLRRNRKLRSDSTAGRQG